MIIIFHYFSFGIVSPANLILSLFKDLYDAVCCYYKIHKKL
jgi:hypothetical protein